MDAFNGVVMNVFVARVALKKLMRSTSSTRQVLAKLIIADLATGYDQMLRLQVLEGAAGVPVDSWWRKGRQGFAIARAHFERDNVDPSWFDPARGDMYGITKNNIQMLLNSWRLRTFAPEDIIHNALMGLRVGIDGEQITRQPYAAGKSAASGIKSGKETPASVARGFLTKYLRDKIHNEAKRVRKEQHGLPENEEGATLDIPDPHSPADQDDMSSDTVYESLNQLVFWDRSDPLGKSIRQIMRQVWSSSQPMTHWLDILESELRIPTKQEVALDVGIAPQTFITRHWNPQWTRFFHALWANRSIMEAIKDRYGNVGFGDWFREPPRIEELVTQRKRAFLVKRIAHRFLASHSSFHAVNQA